MPDKQVRDEAMTFVLAGHESTFFRGDFLRMQRTADFLSESLVVNSTGDMFLLGIC